ncbi:uncharacterized protein LOC126997169 [Eriocheir sinensis]|uniref:uncharacterized protein LOC126997169 n=1 Tax=Eriocheir sinensis TaxID=95602 RepID=UPI0021C92A16|nr:uncharacterized protein LOC126997169 [Eriocheir sinensis]
MHATLSLLLLLLTSSTSPALDHRCPADITISGAEEWANITTVQSITTYQQAYLFVHPDAGFQGVRIVAAGDGWLGDAWFTLDSTCFPLDAEWWLLHAEEWRVQNNYNNNDDDLVFRVWTGVCDLECRRRGRFPGGGGSLIVAAQGPSRWRLEDPRPPCPLTNYRRQSLTYQTINCTKPTATSANTTSSTTTFTSTASTTKVVMVAVVMVVVMTVVVVVVTVVVKRRVQQPRNASAGDMKWQSRGAAPTARESMNSLYEAYDNTGGR